MKHRIILAMASAVALSACASNYPNLIEGAAPPPARVAKGEIDLILDQAVALQKSYGTGYKETAQWQDYSQLPIIGAAAWAAWVLLVDKANAARTAGKIGIGAATYSTARGQLTSPGLPDAYIAGHGALTCVIAEGSMFTGTSAESREADLNKKLQAIATAINETQTAKILTAGHETETLKTARTMADQAIAAAQTAEMAGLTQQGAFQNAAPIFRNAVSSISVRVASKGRVRPAIDYATLRDSFAPPKPPDTTTTNSLNNDVATLTNNLIASTGRLVRATGLLTASTPPYTQSLARVAACPDQIR